MICKTINTKEITKIIFKTNIIFIACNIVYLTLNWFNIFLLFLFGNSNEIIDIKQTQNIFFLKITFLISIFSCFVQYFLSIFTYKIIHSKQILVILWFRREFNRSKERDN